MSNSLSLYDLKYPIGEFKAPQEYTSEIIELAISDIEYFPKRLKETTSHLTEEQLDTIYRPGGWTIRQVIHHCADSHMNSYIRFKRTVTENTPTITPYFEDRWAELSDGKSMDIECSLLLLEALHKRWVTFLKSLSTDNLDRCFFHPEHQKEFSIKMNICVYAWHSNHHLSHITECIKRKGWN